MRAIALLQRSASRRPRLHARGPDVALEHAQGPDNISPLFRAHAQQADCARVAQRSDPRAWRAGLDAPQLQKCSATAALPVAVARATRWRAC